jgi:hypothetical protein
VAHEAICQIFLKKPSPFRITDLTGWLVLFKLFSDAVVCGDGLLLLLKMP